MDEPQGYPPELLEEDTDLESSTFLVECEDCSPEAVEAANEEEAGRLYQLVYPDRAVLVIREVGRVHRDTKIIRRTGDQTASRFSSREG